MNNTSHYKTPAGESAVMALYDKALAQWPVPYTTLEVETRHGRAFTIASGEPGAPALILLHGAGSNSIIWGADVVKYSRQHRVYAVDLPGEAGRSAPNRPDWKGPAFAEWLQDVLDGLGVQQATLAGISQGGWTALKFATSYPERVSKLALLCPGGVTPDRLSFVFTVMRLSLMGRRGEDQLMRTLYGSQPITPEALEITHLMLTQFKGRMGVLPIFSDAQLRRLLVPVLLLLGGQDPLRPSPRIAARLQALLPHVTTVILPKAGHVLLNTTSHILPFLAATELHVARDVGRYGEFVGLGSSGRPDAVDTLMQMLASNDDLPTLKLADFAIGLVNTPEGGERLRHYLLNGSQRQRNYATLYFKRRGNSLALTEAVAKGAIDREQAFAE